MEYAHVLNRPDRRLSTEIQEALSWSESAEFAVSFVRMTGLQLLLPKMKSFAQRGGKLRVLTSTYMDVTEPQALRSLFAQEKDVETRLITPIDAGFHSKAYLFATASGREQAWVGSSNLTKGGLSTNLEWNLSSKDHAVCREAKEQFEWLWTSATSAPLTPALIDAYERRRRERVLPPLAPDGPMLPLAAEGAFGLRVPNALQAEALAGLQRMRAEGARRALVIAATGVGKTFLAAFDAQHVGAKQLLFVAHRRDILVQAERSLREILAFERDDACLLFDSETPGNQPFVFATTQSLSGLAKRKHPLLRRRFDYVVVDEFHHAGAPSWRALLGELETAFLLGLTATPERTDGRDIYELCDNTVAYEVRLPRAIEEKILIPFHYFGIPDDHFTEERVPWRNGRFDPEALARELELPERVDNLIKNAEEKGFDGPKRVAIGFCESRRHAEYMASQFALKNRESVVLLGDDDRETRDRIYARLQNPTDPLEWLFVVDLLNEGVDLPAINVIAMLRPTESMTLFLQQLGRGLRKSPGTDVLTVLDFVGTHRKAFLPLQALNNPEVMPAGGSAVERELKVSAPPFCEFLLEDRTIEILNTIKERTRTQKDKAREAYEAIKTELRRPPRPIDFWNRGDQLSFAAVRNAFGGWRQARIAMGDADAWEKDLEDDSALARLLTKAESNWQQGRVTAYAALLAALRDSSNLMAGYAAFFAEHPQWSAERDASMTEETLREKIARELGPKIWTRTGFQASIARALQGDGIRQAIEERLLPAIAEDHRRRHAGNLKTPGELKLFNTYDRAEVVNHFGVQYDPMRHNSGLFEVQKNQFVILIKLDTSGAKKQFQYRNALRKDRRHFEWSSQNRQRRDNAAGRAIVDHEKLGSHIFLFVQPHSHAKAVFLGEVVVDSVKGDAPMQVVLRLPQAVPVQLAAELGVP